MNRISAMFQQGPAYIGYLTAGDGGYQPSLTAMLALIEGGISLLEVGVPFSDPIADGPSIQQASQRALEAGFSLQDVFRLVAELRTKTTIPIVLFSYFNPIFCYKNDFYADAKNAGIDGILVVDLPLEEATQHVTACKQQQLDPIFLISPSTSHERLQLINQSASGMLYYVCRNGTTGIQSTFPENFATKMAEIKLGTHLPIVTGFGISDKNMAALALQHADGFVVGSLFVDAAYRAKSPEALTAIARKIDPR